MLMSFDVLAGRAYASFDTSGDLFIRIVHLLRDGYKRDR